MPAIDLVEKLEALEAATDQLASKLRHAKVLARMEANGKTPERNTTLAMVDEAIDRWNVLINLVPRDLKAIKLNLLEKGK